MPISLFKRLVAFSYDSLIVIALLMATTALVMAMNGGVAVFPEDGLRYYILQTCLLSVIACYFGLFWAFAGQTIGMKTWKIRLVDVKTQQPPSLSVCLVRITLAVVTFGIGLLPALWRKDKATLYDIVTRTQLIAF